MHQACSKLLDWTYLLIQTLQTPQAHYLLGCLVLIAAIVGCIWKIGLIGRATVVIITVKFFALTVLVLSYLVHLHKEALNSIVTEIGQCVAATLERVSPRANPSSSIQPNFPCRTCDRSIIIASFERQGMYAPLQKIEEINYQSRMRLTKVLSELHSVRLANVDRDRQDNSTGAAFFFAFDPWDTCLRVPSGSFRYFSAAERTGLISRDDMDDLFRTLLDESAEMRAGYRGHFKHYFTSSPANKIFSQYKHLNSLTESGLDLVISSADILFETCPWPVLASKHLQTQIFEDVQVASEIEHYSKSEWLAWTGSLDMTCLGPWLGFSKDKIIDIIRKLCRASEQQDMQAPEDNEVVGQKVVIPLFAHGFQGIVVGFFRDVPKDKRSAIVSTLSQFGQTLADVYGSARMAELFQISRSIPDDQTLLRAVVNAVSPVNSVVLEKDGKRIGYELAMEREYWAGYRVLSEEYLYNNSSPARLSFKTLEGSIIYVDPISNIPGIDDEFSATRLEYLLRSVFDEAVNVNNNVNVLSVDEVKSLRLDFEYYVREEKSSLAKWRQFYILSKIEKNWGSGSTAVSNSELKGFLQDRLSREVKSGYQVTSFVGEIEKMFGNKVALVKTRNVLSLSWSPSSS